MDVAREALGGVLKSVAATPFGQDAEQTDESADGHIRTAAGGTIQFSLFGPEDHPVVDEIRHLDVNDLTPMESLTLIARWKKSLELSDKKKKRR